LNRNNTGGRSRWISAIAGLLLIVAIGALQAAVFSKMVGEYETKVAGVLQENAEKADSQKRRVLLDEAESRLERAIAADPANGWAYWLLSKQRLFQAAEAATRAEQWRIAAEDASAKGNKDQATFCSSRHKAALRKREDLLKEAEELAHRGSLSFNSVGCFKQLASVYMRQADREDPERYLEMAAKAERYLQIVARIKPNDIEAIERLGLLKLNFKKWDELRDLCDQILRSHPYSANVYFYKAFIAKEENDRDEFFLNVRQAYLMMRQNTGEIFFDRQQLEKIAKSLGLVEGQPQPKDRQVGPTSP